MASISFCEIYLVRHGETNWNKESRIQGHTDIPLNAKGEEQALALKEKLDKIDFALALSSDLCRAQKTAEILLQSRSIKMITTPDLRERFYGIWEGKFSTECISEYKKWYNHHHDAFMALPKEEYMSTKWCESVETSLSIYKRFKDCIDLHASNYVGSSILVATHGNVLSSVLHYLDFIPGRTWKVNNCALVILRFENGNLSLISHENVESTLLGNS